MLSTSDSLIYIPFNILLRMSVCASVIIVCTYSFPISPNILIPTVENALVCVCVIYFTSQPQFFLPHLLLVYPPTSPSSTPFLFLFRKNLPWLSAKHSISNWRKTKALPCIKVAQGNQV